MISLNLNSHDAVNLMARGLKEQLEKQLEEKIRADVEPFLKQYIATRVVEMLKQCIISTEQDRINQTYHIMVRVDGDFLEDTHV